ncbi:DUF6412 domain-containing protein [Microbacterium sp. ASV49]|uniref:DUF6412 domain-containing protein n=1 Tax=Microbacterium candidum TaxID=3041922 RepID=A0ABT7MZR0_9MICO|nr:DUF6412 domain-containing protein [Microbacterium sp. ASV49]MDL9979939.1 DUF6412 domain-containing protein [Microbacterium sp. ASV49]
MASIGVMLRLLLDLVHATVAPIATMTRTVLELVSTALATDAGAFALVAATAAFALLALLAVAVSLTRSPGETLDSAAPHPRRAISDATRLTETHPDAPGHSRPRAPGFAALAA